MLPAAVQVTINRTVGVLKENIPALFFAYYAIKRVGTEKRRCFHSNQKIAFNHDACASCLSGAARMCSIVAEPGANVLNGCWPLFAKYVANMTPLTRNSDKEAPLPLHD